MKLKTKEVIVPATVKHVIDDVQRISTKGCGMNMEVNMSGTHAELATYRVDSPHSQGGNAADIRQLAEFLTAIAVELEKRSGVQS